MFTKRRLLVFLVDVVFITTAYVSAFLLRFDFNVSRIEGDPNLFLPGFIVVLAVKPLVFLSSKLYRSLWRYASLQDAVEIFKTVFCASVVSFGLLLFFNRTQPFSQAIVILDWLLLFAMMSASRLAWRTYRETYIIPRSGRDRRTSSRTLIVGAGDAGNLLLREIRKQHDSPYGVIGFLDDDPAKQGMRLNGVPVLGALDTLCDMVRKHRIEKVVIAMPSVGKRKIREIVRSCDKARVRVKTLPGIGELIQGQVSVSHIKDVEIEDLLGREQVQLDEAGIRRYLAGKKVLVTGAGGSIGSEICRQVARFAPAKIVLLDNAETPLFHIDKELTAAWPGLRVIPVLGSVKDAPRVEEVFKEFRPEVVFHAAAYKHVPMMEFNPVEAITNNIGGTRILADTADRYRVADFVMISTDKAVNPTNTMGASKRVAELYVQALAARGSTTRFTTVRFGNVLGSNGSVIPMFKEQIKKGGPVTVTDPRVVRYFMTIPEATQLVLQAGCLGKGGEIFVLDMGEPVLIRELAEELIKLSGLVPYVDIDIRFTGLRPGEKLYEELLLEGEGIKPTLHEKIRVLAAVTHDPAWLAWELKKLFAEAEAFRIDGVMASLRRLVPEFSPAYHFDGEAPPAFQQLRPDLFPVESLPHRSSERLPSFPPADADASPDFPLPQRLVPGIS